MQNQALTQINSQISILELRESTIINKVNEFIRKLENFDEHVNSIISPAAGKKLIDNENLDHLSAQLSNAQLESFENKLKEAFGENLRLSNYYYQIISSLKHHFLLLKIHTKNYLLENNKLIETQQPPSKRLLANIQKHILSPETQYQEIINKQLDILMNPLAAIQHIQDWLIGFSSPNAEIYDKTEYKIDRLKEYTAVLLETLQQLYPGQPNFYRSLNRKLGSLIKEAEEIAKTRTASTVKASENNENLELNILDFTNANLLNPPIQKFTKNVFEWQHPALAQPAKSNKSASFTFFTSPKLPFSSFLNFFSIFFSCYRGRRSNKDRHHEQGTTVEIKKESSLSK